MRSITPWYALLLASVLATAPSRAQDAPAEAADQPGLDLTVYNENFALVKDRRAWETPLKQGQNFIRFTDVAATIDAASVFVRSLTDPAATVSEQNYEFDLVGGDKLLEKYLEKPITVYTTDGRLHEGTLLSFDAQRLVLTDDPEKGPISLIERGENIERIRFGQLPEGLLVRPTLVWELFCEQAGEHLLEVSYIAHQVRWRADYSLVLSEDETTADLSGWVTLENNCGTAFADARIKLMAGTPRIDRTNFNWGFGYQYLKQLSQLAPSSERGEDPSEVVGEYRMYRLPEQSTLANNQIKQVELIVAEDVPLTKTYLYDGAAIQWVRGQSFFDPGFGREENKKVNVVLEIENRAEAHLGISLPSGKVRTYKADSDQSLEFLGEDQISHTPRDEKLLLYIGDAFDIVGERKQTDFQRVADNVFEEAFEITLRNHKTEAVTVKVLEKMYRASEWKLMEKSHDNEQLDSRTIVFPVEVPADGEVKVRYRVRYQ